MLDLTRPFEEARPDMQPLKRPRTANEKLEIDLENIFAGLATLDDPAVRKRGPSARHAVKDDPPCGKNDLMIQQVQWRQEKRLAGRGAQ